MNNRFDFVNQTFNLKLIHYIDETTTDSREKFFTCFDEAMEYLKDNMFLWDEYILSVVAINPLTGEVVEVRLN